MSKTHRLRRANTPAVRGAETDAFSHDSTAAAVRRLTALVEAQARIIGHDQSTLARSRDIFERASAAARLGTWECDLSTETLQWSGGTYDMFDIPRGSPLVRKQTLACYPAESLKMLESIRSRAIEQRTDFNLDAEILTAKGRRRWIRITAMVECAGDRPIRLFGIKQDVTEEKIRWERLRNIAEFDELTGLANRSQFHARLSALCAASEAGNRGGVLLLIDLDGFKEVNDSLGHAAGDACLKEAAQRVSDVCRKAGTVARIGGDEFAVLLETHYRIEAADLARRIIMAMSRPINCGGQTFKIGASVGIASADGRSSHEMFQCADAALYAAKSGGRNTFRWFDPQGSRNPTRAGVPRRYA
jgi:diguanylate cyclase (GGDEF)-like protein